MKINIVEKNRCYFFIICSIFLFSCNEQFPLREEVSDIVTIKIWSLYYTKSHSPYPGQIRTYISVMNNTDETLDDISPLIGSVEINWTPRQEEGRQFRTSKTLKLSAENIFHGTYNKFTKRLTLDPGDSLVLSVDWDLVTDDGTDLFKYFHWNSDLKCRVYYAEDINVSPKKLIVGYRSISDQQNFMVKANIKLFDRLAMLYIQNIKISECFMYGHEGEGDLNQSPCTDFTQFDPCSVIGQ